MNVVSERIFVRKFDHNLWQWRLATNLGQWQSEAFYTGDINLVAETIRGRSISLILPGQLVGSQNVETDLKDRKMVAKVIPFQIEEFIVDSIDDLVFAYGPVTNGVVPALYVDESYAQTAISELEAVGADVQRCLVDYLELSREPNYWTLVLEGDRLLVADGPLSGFVTERHLAPLYLSTAFAEQILTGVTLVAQDEEDLNTLKSWLPTAVSGDENLVIQEEIGGFWDFFLIQPKPLIDFRQGRLARRLPFMQWLNEWKIPASAFAAAFLLAVGVSYGELYSAKQTQRKIFAERDDIFRQVIPGGSIADPVRQLKGKLGNTNQVEPSNLIGMMASVGPAMEATKEVKLSSFRYTHDNGELQLNLEAKDIATLEALRSKIAESGLNAEIKRASVSGETNQAQMRITGGRS